MCIYVTGQRVPQTQQFGGCVMCYRCGAVVFAPHPARNSEDFQAIFTSDLDSAPVPHPYFVYLATPQRAAVTDISVLGTRHELFRGLGPYIVKLRLL